MNEIWKDIPGFEGLYEASSLGRIRTKEGKTTKSRRFPKRVWKQRILKQKWKCRGNSKKMDARVCLWIDGKEKTLLVSRCICSAFHPIDNAERMTVNHIDGDPTNNRAENLEWLSASDNTRHGFSTGLFDGIMKRVVLVDRTGNKFCFPSMAKACVFLQRCHGYVSGSIKHNRPICSADGQEYECIIENNGG